MLGIKMMRLNKVYALCCVALVMACGPACAVTDCPQFPPASVEACCVQSYHADAELRQLLYESYVEAYHGWCPCCCRHDSELFERVEKKMWQELIDRKALGALPAMTAEAYYLLLRPLVLEDVYSRVTGADSPCDMRALYALCSMLSLIPQNQPRVYYFRHVESERLAAMGVKIEQDESGRWYQILVRNSPHPVNVRLVNSLEDIMLDEEEPTTQPVQETPPAYTEGDSQ